MKGGRKNLKRATEEKSLTIEDGHCIMRVVDLSGSNLIEVMDAKGNKSLALFPAKFQQSMWIKRGSFVVVDENGKEKALESGSKVACIVTKVLFYEQVRSLQISPDWPEIFKFPVVNDYEGNLQQPTYQKEENELESSDDDGLLHLKPIQTESDHLKCNLLQNLVLALIQSHSIFLTSVY